MSFRRSEWLRFDATLERPWTLLVKSDGPSLEIVQPCARNSAISSRSGSDKYLPERGCADGPNIAGRMPPAFLNHRAPTACGTPAVAEASSLTKPAEIAAQNLLICSQFATVGRPGDRKAARPERSDCRFHLFIAALSRRCDDHLNSLNTSQSSIPSAWRRQASNLRLGIAEHYSAAGALSGAGSCRMTPSSGSQSSSHAARCSARIVSA